MNTKFVDFFFIIASILSVLLFFISMVLNESFNSGIEYFLSTFYSCFKMAVVPSLIFGIIALIPRLIKKKWAVIIANILCIFAIIGFSFFSVFILMICVLLGLAMYMTRGELLQYDKKIIINTKFIDFFFIIVSAISILLFLFMMHGCSALNHGLKYFIESVIICLGVSVVPSLIFGIIALIPRLIKKKWAVIIANILCIFAIIGFYLFSFFILVAINLGIELAMHMMRGGL